MRSSAASRAGLAFQRELSIIPPLLCEVTVAALREISVETVHAEAEADGLVAEIAERRGGFAVSSDSDMYVLCSRGEGCGYVPLQTLEYLVKPKPVEGQEEQEGQSAGDGFEQVATKKRRGGRSGMHSSSSSEDLQVYTHDILANPRAADEIQLHAVRFESHSAAKLAALLGIPSTFLPLLATFNGNDYTSHTYSQLLALRFPEGPERITAIAGLIKQEWQNLAKGGGGRGSNGSSPRTGSGSNTPAVPESRGSRTPVKRVGLGRLSGPAFSSMSNAYDHRDDDGRSAPSSGTATPLAAANRRLGPGSKEPSIASMQTVAPQAGVSAIEVSTALALDPVRDLVIRVLDQIIAPKQRMINPRAGPGLNPILERLEASGEREALVNSLLDGLAEYSLLTNHSAPHLTAAAAEFFRPRAHSASADAAYVRRRNMSWWDAKPNAEVVTAWQEAYKQGRFAGDLVDALTGRYFVTRASLEDPDTPSAQATSLRKLRRWLWSILFSGGAWGMAWARPTLEEPEPTPEEDDDDAESNDDSQFALDTKIKWIGGESLKEDENPEDMIAVQTPSSFGDDDGPLARRLREEEDDEDEDEPEDVRSQPGSAVGDTQEDTGVKPPPIVTEYVRRGDRIKGDTTQIQHLAELLAEDRAVLSPSLLELLGQYEAHDAALEEASSASASTPGSQPGSPRLAPPDMQQSLNAALEAASDPLPSPVPLLRVETRVELALASLGVSAQTVGQLPLPLQFSAALMRYLISEEAERLGESTKRYNWTDTEVKAAVFASTWATRSLLDQSTRTQLEARAQRALDDIAATRAQPTARSIHLCAVMQSALLTVEHIMQALLLTEAVPILPTSSFEGSLFHAHLLGQQSNAIGATEVERSMYAAIAAGLESLLAVDVATARAEKKKNRKESKASSREGSGASSPVPTSRANMFDMLGGEE